MNNDLFNDAHVCAFLDHADAASADADVASSREEICSSVDLYRKRLLDVEELVERVSTILSTCPKALLSFNSLLPLGYSIQFHLDGEDVRFIVIITPTGARIHALTALANYELPSVSKTEILRMALINKVNLWEELALLKVPLASCVMQLLQFELDSFALDRKYLRQCLHLLRKLAKAHGVLPPSFYIHNASKEGKHPITGGGFADIWRGKIGDQAVCLKVLRIFTTESVREKIIKEFCHEALVWRQLNHPYLLPFLGVSKDLFEPSFCLMSPFMDNGNIVAFLEKNPDYNRVVCMYQIAEGLCYLHELSPKIIHGDVRGANILVKDDLSCCLSDFGLALVSESQPLDSSSVTNGGAMRWLGPEVIVPRRFSDMEIDRTTRDVYAFGCTTLEIFTGKPPFSHHRVDMAVMYDVLNGIRPPRPDTTSMPDELWETVEACWTERPDERPSMQTVTQTLRRLCISEGANVMSSPDLCSPGGAYEPWTEIVEDWLDSQFRPPTAKLDGKFDAPDCLTPPPQLEEASWTTSPTEEFRSHHFNAQMDMVPAHHQAPYAHTTLRRRPAKRRGSRDPNFWLKELKPPNPPFRKEHIKVPSFGSDSSTSSNVISTQPGHKASLSEGSDYSLTAVEDSSGSAQSSSPRVLDDSPRLGRSSLWKNITSEPKMYNLALKEGSDFSLAAVEDLSPEVLSSPEILEDAPSFVRSSSSIATQEESRLYGLHQKGRSMTDLLNDTSHFALRRRPLHRASRSAPSNIPPSEAESRNRPTDTSEVSAPKVNARRNAVLLEGTGIESDGPVYRWKSERQTTPLKTSLSTGSIRTKKTTSHEVVPTQKKGIRLQNRKVQLSDPTWKVLPLALEKYRIQSDSWQDYVMLICYEDGTRQSERCVRYDEHPLELFQKLKDAGQNPVFKLMNVKNIPSPSALIEQKYAQRRIQRGNKDVKVSVTRPVISSSKSSKNIGYAIAICSYVADQEDELDVVAGDAFIVFEKGKKWSIVQFDSSGSGEVDPDTMKRGWAPAGCFLMLNVPAENAILFTNPRIGQIHTPSSQMHGAKAEEPILPSFVVSTTSKQLIASTNYTARGTDELSLLKGDKVHAYKRNKYFSYVSREDGHRGWVPMWLLRDEIRYDGPSLHT